MKPVWERLARSLEVDDDAPKRNRSKLHVMFGFYLLLAIMVGAAAYMVYHDVSQLQGADEIPGGYGQDHSGY